ncbi:MAG: ATP-dependent Clp protease proteolytic subunit [Chitinophagales bacterium]|nr:ATP-dependent Clp protease proteolytic subunit [Chitinophagales bacterium]
MNNIILENVISNEMPSDIFQKMYAERTIFISDIISDEVASGIVATLLLMDSKSDDKITIFLNSEFSLIQNVMPIYDAMRITRSPKSVICMGSAIGESALILAAGTKGLRFSTPNALIGLTKASFDNPMYSDLTNVKIELDQMKKYNKMYTKELGICCNRSKTIEKDLEKPLFLNPKEAKKFGVIDDIIKHGKS